MAHPRYDPFGTSLSQFGYPLDHLERVVATRASALSGHGGTGHKKDIRVLAQLVTPL